MTTPARPGIKLFFILLFLLGTLNGFSQCKTINADARVTKDSDSFESGSTIVIEYKDANSNRFEVNLFGPAQKNELQSQKTSFANMGKGDYVIIITAKREDDNYCPRTLKVTIN